MKAERREQVAARIKELRGVRPQPKIADAVGVTLRAYQEWEAGGGIAWENLERLAEVFNVSEDYLLNGDEGDHLRAGTQIERIEETQRRMEAKLDQLLAVLTQLAAHEGDDDPFGLAHFGREPFTN